MNKKDFTRYINEQLDGLSLDRQIQVLQKVHKNYLPDLIRTRQKKLGTWVPQEEKANYMFCEACKRYSLTSKCKKENVTEVRTVTTFKDCGYGDDDKLGDVEYSVIYVTCPRCGRKQEQNKYRLRVLREWNRNEGRR